MPGDSIPIEEWANELFIVACLIPIGSMRSESES